MTSSTPLPSTSRLCTVCPSLVTLKVTLPAFAVGSAGSILNSVSEKSSVSPEPPADTVVDDSVSLDALVELLLSSPPHAARTSGITIANRARDLRTTKSSQGVAFIPRYGRGRVWDCTSGRQSAGPRGS